MRALRGADLTVRAGEFVALMGPSGSGKSTLLHLVAGLDRADEGTVALAGVRTEELSSTRLARLRRRHVGLVFQFFHLIEHLSALENVALAALIAGARPAEATARARDLLDTLGLLDRAAERPGALSGGQRQRVAIARALANRPTLLLADEPTGALDSAGAAEVLDLFQPAARHRPDDPHGHPQPGGRGRGAADRADARRLRDRRRGRRGRRLRSRAGRAGDGAVRTGLGGRPDRAPHPHPPGRPRRHRGCRVGAMTVVNDRPGRRARLALLVAGLLVAVAVGVLGAAIGFLGARLVPGAVAVLAGLAVVAGVAAGWSAQARRSSTGVLVAAAAVTAVCAAILLGLVTLLLLLGRLPAGAERRVVGPAVVAIVVAAACAGPFARRAARRTRAAMHAVRRSPDELLADFAENAGRGSPVDDLLRTLAESMRRDWQLSRVEVWTGLDDPTAAQNSTLAGRADPGLHRTLVVPSALDPDADPVPPPLEPAELGMLRRVGVAGPGWLRLWVPRLLDGHENAGPLADRQLRFAPALHGGSVLALVVVERPPDALPFSTADDRALAEVARRLAIVLRNRSLDEALQATLADLRRANADLQASRRRLVTTADAERKRIERDLHDGAQQHLVALAVGIRLVRDSLAACASPADIELLDELDRGVRESIGSLRDLAHGIYPPLLRDSGPGGGAARRGEAQRASRHGVRVEPGPPSRAGGGRGVLLLPRGAGQRGQARARGRP